MGIEDVLLPKPTGKKCKKCNENIYEDDIDFCVQPDGTYLCTQCIWEENNLQRILNENK